MHHIGVRMDDFVRHENKCTTKLYIDESSSEWDDDESILYVVVNGAQVIKTTCLSLRKGIPPPLRTCPAR